MKVFNPIHGASAFSNEILSPKNCSVPPAAVTVTCADAQLAVDQEIKVDPDKAPAGMMTTSGLAVI